MRLHNCADYFRLRPADDVNAFILYVRPRFQVSVLRRIVQDVIENEAEFAHELRQQAGLFRVLIEEDPGYRQIQMLQDAGLIPVDAMQPINPGRPRGVSNNIPQAAIDEMMAADANMSAEQIQETEIVDTQRSQFAPVDDSQAADKKGLLDKEEGASIEEPLMPVAKPHRNIKLPTEPTAEDENSTRMIFRLPISGQRIERHFLKTDRIATLYDFVDQLQYDGKCRFEGVDDWTDDYALLQMMPRRKFDDKSLTLLEAKLFPRGAVLQIEKNQEDDDDEE